MANRKPNTRNGRTKRKLPPILDVEPWSRTQMLWVGGAVALLIGFVVLAAWMSREPGETGPNLPGAYDDSARRAAIEERTAAERERAVARLSWGAAGNATPAELGAPAPVRLPVADGRAAAAIRIPRHGDGKLPFRTIQVAVFSGDQRVFANTLDARQAQDSGDVATLSLNAEAVRALGAEPLTVRVTGFDAGGRHSGEAALGEVRLAVERP